MSKTRHDLERPGISAAARAPGIFDGLTSQEAARRLALDGPNTLPAARSRSVLSIALEVLREPMLLLLVAAGVIYLALGDTGEALLIVSLACATVLIAIVQQTRSERVIEKLADLTDPMPAVCRDGVRQRVPSASLVRGDLILLEEGDRVAADAVILEGHGLEADESLLTGESVSVVKSRAPEPAPDEAGDLDGVADRHKLFSGSLIVRGGGMARVAATGANSTIGQIGKSLSQIEGEAPPLREQIRGAVLLFAVVGIALSALVFLISGLVRGAWLEGLLGGIALSMALLPEEFPVVLTVFLVMGAWRISKVNVLTRRGSAIETLGSASVLCTDKTGTLTENRMSIVELWADGERAMPGPEGDACFPPAFVGLLAAGRMASEPSPVDAMDKAFHDAAGGSDAAGDGMALVKRYLLNESFLAVVHVWRGPQGEVAACKGAPETVLAHCGLAPAERERIEAAVHDMARRGIRVLAIATAHRDAAELPDHPSGFDFVFRGLVGLQDPLHEGVAEAVKECRAAGIRVVMITGDHPVTARAIARQAGLDATDGVVTGDELMQFPADALADRVRTATIFARTRPEQKLRIVEALKANGEIVAMTGDGVNDAPALKAAHIGIAMGRRGTEVAREASAIVLLDDNFASIVRTIRLGRRIYGNLRKAISFVMAAHVPIAGLALFPLLFGLPLMLLPVHIAFIELIIDPVCSLAFEAEPEDRNVMLTPPRDPDEALLPWSLIGWSMIQGVIALLAVTGVPFAALSMGLPSDTVRALSFIGLVTAIFALVLSARSLHQPIWTTMRIPNWTLFGALALDAAIVLGIFLIAPARDLFRFAPVGPGAFVLAVGIGVGMLLAFELVKALGKRRTAAATPLRSA